MAREFLGKIEYLVEQGFAVRCVNSVNDEALRTLFTRAAALLATTHYEGFGLPTLEAMLYAGPSYLH